MVALNESNIVHRLTQNTRNTVSAGHGPFGNSCSETAVRLQNLGLYLATCY